MFRMFSRRDGKQPKVVALQVASVESDVVDDTKGQSNIGLNDPDNKYRKKRSDKFSTLSTLAVLLYLVVIFFVVIYMDQRLPPPLTLRDASQQPGRFVEERARITLKKLTSVGARPAGSYENEILAADFIRRQLESMKKRANPIHKVTIDVQKPRGSFNLGFGEGFTHHYRNIQNIVAKLESNHGAKDALLVNCHFDTVPQSPGASDDAVSCAIMLEMLEVLTQADVPLKYNLILLFNGAEENILPASHGFITQHVWANDIRAFINLEACGAGGRELVFQTGPAHPWLVRVYAKVAPYPFAMVMAQEIFQSGLITSDTDFRIFRDHGNIPGLDIAYMKNGYVYHTKYDTEERIPKGSIQRAGDNVLAVVKHLTQESDILGHMESSSRGSAVFFDVLGLFMVHYHELVGDVVNLLVIAASVTITYRKAKSSFQCGVSGSTFVNQLGYTFFIQVVGCIASLVSVTLIALLLDALNKTMSWYSKPYLIVVLFMAPTVTSILAVFRFALARQKKVFQFPDGAWVIESLYFEVSRLVWTFFTLVMTVARLKSAFFCMFWVLFPMVGRYVLERIYDSNGVKRKPRDWKWLTVYMMSMTIPVTLNMYLISIVFTVFIPIMGRSGPTFNPDLVIGYMTASVTLATMSYLCPLIMVVKRPNNVITTLYLTTFVSAVLIATTSLGFPYSASSNNLTPHRSLVVHTAREFYDKGGNLNKEDSGYFLFNLDRNSPSVLMGWVPEMANIKRITRKQCDEHLRCGLPAYYPVSLLYRINHWINAEKPKIFQDTVLKLLHFQHPSPDVVKVLFETRGPDRTAIYLSPAAGVSLDNWSFADGEVADGPVWKDGRRIYHIFHSHGLVPAPFQFWLEFKVPRDYMRERHDLMDIVIAGHFVHGTGMQSPGFKEFLAQFPTWSYPVGWTASVKSYKF